MPLAETLGALARVKQAGLARHIGVSNFTVALIEEAVAACPEPLVCDQVEYHPYLDQTKVREACARHGMALVAYSPVAKGRIKNDRALLRIGDRYRKSARRCACAGWCSRTWRRSRAPRGSNGSRRISRSSTSNCPTRTCGRFPRMAKRRRPAHRLRFRAEMGLRSGCAGRYARARGDIETCFGAMKLRRIIPTDMTASALAHLSLLALVFLFSEVHPFGAVTAEPIAVDIVASQDIAEQAAAGKSRAREGVRAGRDPACCRNLRSTSTALRARLRLPPNQPPARPQKQAALAAAAAPPSRQPAPPPQAGRSSAGLQAARA